MGNCKTINILGMKWTVEISNPVKDAFLDNCDGYCDKTSRRIVVTEEDKSNELDDFRSYQRKVLRHEIVHAFLFESGLHENWTHANGHDETYVDWIAAQWPKIAAVFCELGIEK